MKTNRIGEWVCQYGWAYIILLSYVGYETAKNIWLPFSIQAGLSATLFVYIGYQAKCKKVLQKEISKPIWGDVRNLGILYVL